MRMRLVAFHGPSRRKGGERTAGGTHGSGRESEREGDECRLFTLEGISSPCGRLDWDYVGRTAGEETVSHDVVHLCLAWKEDHDV